MEIGPESLRPMADTIKVVRHIGTGRAGWAERQRIVMPLIADSMCEVQRRQRQDRTSLAAVRPLDSRPLRHATTITSHQDTLRPPLGGMPIAGTRTYRVIATMREPVPEAT